MPLPDDAMFLAQVDQAVATIPETVEASVRAICTEHESLTLRAHLIDWIFFEHWRWGEGWLVDERRGSVMIVSRNGCALTVRQ